MNRLAKDVPHTPDAGLAVGQALEQAITVAKRYVQAAIESAPGLGGGHGPVNHFAVVR